MHSLNTFGVRTNHGQLRTHKTHHSPDLGEATTFPPYIMLCAFPWDPTSKWHFILGLPKFPKLRFLRLWGPITLCANLWLRWGLKQSCRPHREISNGVLHLTFMQGNRVNSRLLVVKNQITNLITDLSFGHNLCFKCANRSWEPILDIYVSIDFQWYKELFNPMGFDLYNRLLKIRPKWEFI
jgi:hypothetical protein